MVLEEFKLTK